MRRFGVKFLMNPKHLFGFGFGQQVVMVNANLTDHWTDGETAREGQRDRQRDRRAERQTERQKVREIISLRDRWTD